MFAHVSNGTIQLVVNDLPETWENTSNLFALENDLVALEKLGWYRVIDEVPPAPEGHEYVELAYHEFIDGKVYQRQRDIQHLRARNHAN